jgi:large subunit ribosomal protein L17
MRHNVAGRLFGRTANQRKALLRGLVGALIEHERIETTVAKAKETKRLAEKLVTLGKRGDVHAKRLAMAKLPNRPLVIKLFDTIAPRFADRNGGYLRIIHTRRRVNDRAEMAVLEFVDYEELRQEKAGEKTKEEKKAKAPAKKAAPEAKPKAKPATEKKESTAKAKKAPAKKAKAAEKAEKDQGEEGRGQGEGPRKGQARGKESGCARKEVGCAGEEGQGGRVDERPSRFPCRPRGIHRYQAPSRQARSSHMRPRPAGPG